MLDFIEARLKGERILREYGVEEVQELRVRIAEARRAFEKLR